MKYIQDLPIRTKLFLTLGIIISITLVYGLVTIGYLTTFRQNAKATLVTRQFSDALSSAAYLDTAFSNITDSYTRTGNTVVRSHYDERLALYQTLIQTTRQLSLATEDHGKFEEIIAVRAKLFAVEDSVFSLYDKGNTAGAVKLLSGNEYQTYKKAFLILIDTESKETRKTTSAFDKNGADILSHVKLFSELALLLILFVGGLLMYIVSSRISGTLLEIEEAAEAIGRGESGKRVAVHSKDEVGRAAVAFNKMAVAVDGDKMHGRLKKITAEVGQ